MEKTTREKLAKVAKDMAQVPFHGEVDGMASNLAPIVRLFPTWNLKEADGLWCAAFVYYLVIHLHHPHRFRLGMNHSQGFYNSLQFVISSSANPCKYYICRYFTFPYVFPCVISSHSTLRVLIREKYCCF